MLQIVPHQLVGVQLRGVRRQDEQLQSLGVLLQELPDPLRLVCGMSVDDQVDRLPPAPDHRLEERHEARPVHPPLDLHPPKLPLGADRRDQVDREALPRLFHRRCLPAWRPRRPGVMVRSHRRLVGEEDPSASRLRLLTDRRILRLQPRRHARLLRLERAPHRTLRGQTHTIVSFRRARATCSGRSD